MAKKKTLDKKSISAAVPSSPDRISAPELPHHLLEALAIHNGEQTSSDTVDTEQLATKTGDELKPVFTDPVTEAAVDDIVHEESDEVLAAEDDKDQTVPQKPRGFWRRIGHFFAAWWGNKVARTITILVILAAIATTAIVPTSRYFVLNFAGVRGSSSISVIDNTTRLPLKNVTVTVGGQKALTDSNGVAHVKNIRLGKQYMVIKRIAFAPVEQQVTIGWGSNPLGEFILDATGVQYRITAKDFVSGKPIVNAEATSGEAVARSDEKGIITLTLEEVDAPTVKVVVSSTGYRAEAMVITSDTQATNVLTLVPSAKTVFASRQNNRVDVVSMYIDGNARKVELPGTGLENKNFGLVTNAAGTQAAVVSTRDDVRDADGFLLSTLTILDLEKGTRQTVSRAQHIQLIDWSSSNLVFVEASAGASASNPNRYRIVSYDFGANRRTQLASANQFNAISSIRGMIYYAVSSTDPSAKADFFRVKPDGTGRQTVFNQEVWTALRIDYNTLLLQSPDSWYTYTIDGSAQKTTQPTQYQSRRYVDGPSGKSLWVDVRSGESVLHAYDAQTKKDQEIKRQPGLSYPVHWLNDGTIIYRVTNGSEAADYAVHSSGGEARKITDVVSTYGFSN
jgi:hypothetical protein